MTTEELIRAGGATLAFDTNAIRGKPEERSNGERRLSFTGFFDIVNNVDRLNKQASPRIGIAVVVPALARMEALHQFRTINRHLEFDVNLVKTVAERKGIRIVAFDDDAAIDASGSLYRWFPTDENWQQAKRLRCLKALGISETDSPGKSGLASIDWAIAAQVEARGWILVTADKGDEFKNVTYKITRERLRSLLDELLSECGLSPRATKKS